MTNQVPFSVRIGVRSYEIDALGHVNQAVYHAYAEHARTQLFHAAGLSFETMSAEGSAPVMLESTMRYRRELRMGDEADVTAAMEFGEGKVFTMRCRIIRTDGVLSAEQECVLGLMDLTARKLLDDPRGRLLTLARHPTLLS